MLPYVNVPDLLYHAIQNPVYASNVEQMDDNERVAVVLVPR